MSGLKVDLNLVQKYNVPGPRYTSYPPTTKFSGDLSWAQLADCIRDNNCGERAGALVHPQCGHVFRPHAGRRERASTFAHNMTSGYQRGRGLLSKIENAAPGLFFAGHYRDGIALGDSIVSGCNAADRVETGVDSFVSGQFSKTCEPELAAFL